MYISRNMEQWNAVIQILRSAFAQGKENELLMLLLTADERDALGLRLQIVRQLLEGNATQREIQQNLNTSVATITRGSNMLKLMDQQFLQWIKQQINQQNTHNKVS